MQRRFCVVGAHYRQSVFVLDDDSLKALTDNSEISRVTLP